jgi:hypothetical protein
LFRVEEVLIHFLSILTIRHGDNMNTSIFYVSTHTIVTRIYCDYDPGGNRAGDSTSRWLKTESRTTVEAGDTR